MFIGSTGLMQAAPANPPQPCCRTTLSRALRAIFPMPVIGLPAQAANKLPITGFVKLTGVLEELDHQTT